MLTVCLPHIASDMCLFSVSVHVCITFFLSSPCGQTHLMMEVTTFLEREKKIIQIHCIRLFDYFTAVIAASTAVTVVTSFAAVFFSFFLLFFHFSTIHCKCSIVYSSSCYPLLYLHFHSITYVCGFWFSFSHLWISFSIKFLGKK